MQSQEPKRPLIILMGPPGSGKGTQGKLLSQQYGLVHVPSGVLIREYCVVHPQSSKCEEIQKLMSAGVPQRDELTIEIMREHLATIHDEKGIIFDAFPLSLDQAKEVEVLRDERNWSKPLVLNIYIDEDTAVLRTAARKICSHCGRTFGPNDNAYQSNICDACGSELIVRSDDTPDVVRHRYQEYITRLKELMTYFEERYGVTKIDGTKTSEEIFQDIVKAVTETFSDVMPFRA